MKTMAAALCTLALVPLCVHATDVYEYQNTVGSLSYSSFLSVTQTGAGFKVGLETHFVYWTFVGYRNDMYKMEAEKLGKETIAINGKGEEAWHIRVKPVGFYSLFWHGDFWFATADGSYRGYEPFEGFGAPLTVTRFKNKTTTGKDSGETQSQAASRAAP